MECPGGLASPRKPPRPGPQPQHRQSSEGAGRAEGGWKPVKTTEKTKMDLTKMDLMETMVHWVNKSVPYRFFSDTFYLYAGTQWTYPRRESMGDSTAPGRLSIWRSTDGPSRPGQGALRPHKTIKILLF